MLSEWNSLVGRELIVDDTCVSCSTVSNSWQFHGLVAHQAPLKNTGVGSHSLLQGIFQTQGSNPGSLLHCRQILYHLSHQGSPVDDNSQLLNAHCVPGPGEALRTY